MKFNRRIRKKIEYIFGVQFAFFFTYITVRAILLRQPRQKLLMEKCTFGFVTYPAVDIWALHLLFANLLKQNSSIKLDIKFFRGVHQIPLDNSVFFFTDAPSLPISYREKVNYLLRKSNGDANIARGMIDQYRRMCGAEEFKEKTVINYSILKEISDSLARAKYITDSCDILVIPDLAYTFNRTVVSLMKNRGAKVLVLTVDGRFLEPEWEEGFAHDMPRAKTILENYDSLSPQFKEIELNRAKSYLQARFEGTSSDRDSQNAFQENDKTCPPNSNPTVFLHCFRDATGDNPFNFPGNEDYFLWTQNLIEFISVNNLNWEIKPHPSRNQHPNEDEILTALLNSTDLRYNSNKLSTNSALAIMRSRSPVVTFAGTIALETAVHGYKSICFGERFPQELCIKQDFSSLLTEGSELDVDYERSELLIERATIALHGMSREAQLAYNLTPSEPIQPNTSLILRKYAYISILIELFRKSGQVEFRETLNTLSKRFVDHATSVRGARLDD